MKMKHLFFRAPRRHTAEAAAGFTQKTAAPLKGWQVRGRLGELTLALNGLKYACATLYFLAVRPNDNPPLDLSNPFRAGSAGKNGLLRLAMPLMDNRLILLNYSTYMAVA